MSQMLPPYASPDACMTIAKRTYQQMLDELAGYKARVAELEGCITGSCSGCVLEAADRDHWKGMAMKYRAALDRAEEAFDAIGQGIFPGSEYRNGHEPYAKSLAIEIRTVLQRRHR